MPLVSIVIPIYNSENYLERSLDSVVRQTFRDFEVILVDDGSTDKSADICKRYSNNYDYIFYVRQDNKGAGSARNVGINQAKGSYISFVDCDDVLESNFLEIMVNNIGNSDICICNFWVHDSEGNITGEVCGLKNGIIDEDRFWELCGETSYAWAIVPWNKLYNFKLFDNVKFKECFYHEDQEIIHRIISQTRSIRILNTKLYHYHNNVYSVTKNNNTIKQHNKIEALLSRIDYFLIKEQFNRFYLSTMNRCLDEYCLFAYKFSLDKKMNKEIRKRIKKGRYGRRCKTFFRWNLQLIFPRLYYCCFEAKSNN